MKIERASTQRDTKAHTNTRCLIINYRSPRARRAPDLLRNGQQKTSNWPVSQQSFVRGEICWLNLLSCPFRTICINGKVTLGLRRGTKQRRAAECLIQLHADFIRIKPIVNHRFRLERTGVNYYVSGIARAQSKRFCCDTSTNSKQKKELNFFTENIRR